MAEAYYWFDSLLGRFRRRPPVYPATENRYIIKRLGIYCSRCGGGFRSRKAVDEHWERKHKYQGNPSD